jgi:predicted alpha/beta-fold hydrolase
MLWLMKPFRQRWPWIGADLQTLRDSVVVSRWPADTAQRRLIPLPDGGSLLLKRDLPPQVDPRGGVLLVHGLAGSSERSGVRRLAQLLVQSGFAVWRLNLRGAGEGRALAAGTYAAACNRDLSPVLAALRQEAWGRPLLGVGLSLGGTVLLNALLAQPDGLDALACVSSPLDLAACSSQIARPRNALYQHYLVRGLIQQTLADPFATPSELPANLNGVRTIRGFDALITAPRWGYVDVDDYYREASPLARIRSGAPLPPLLLIHALDDPWVPVASLQGLAGQHLAAVEICLPPWGGHNGFHGVDDPPASSWADRCVVDWLSQRCS